MVAMFSELQLKHCSRISRLCIRVSKHHSQGVGGWRLEVGGWTPKSPGGTVRCSQRSAGFTNVTVIFFSRADEREREKRETERDMQKPVRIDLAKNVGNISLRSAVEDIITVRRREFSAGLGEGAHRAITT